MLRVDSCFATSGNVTNQFDWMVRGVALHMKRISDSLANFVRTTFQLFICKEQLFLRNLVFGSHQMVKSPLDFAKTRKKTSGPRGRGRTMHARHWSFMHNWKRIYIRASVKQQLINYLA